MGFQNLLSSRRCDHFHSFFFYILSRLLYSHLHLIIFICFPGDNSSRRDRMLNDIYLWVRDSSPRWNKRSHEASLVIFSDQFNDDSYYTHMLQKLSKRGYNLLLVTPTQDIKEPESPEWPGLLIDEGSYCFGD